MMRTLIVTALVALSLTLAGAASGASLSLDFDKSSYVPGDTMILTLSDSVDGESREGAHIRLEAEGVEWLGATQDHIFTLFDGAIDWLVFDTICPAGDPTICIAVNQSNPTIANPFPVDAFTGIIATITGIARAPGLVTVTVDSPEFSIFGDVESFSVSNRVVPEPGTAALLGLGLLGFCRSIRRR